MFTTIQAGHYQPLSWLTFALDHALWGMNPHGYHLTSLLLHAGCAVAVLYLLFDLVAAARPEAAPRALAWAAAAGALLFALHPLRVETVAWATERRGALSGVLLVLAVDSYVRWARAAGPASRYWGAVVLFALSLLAKEVGFTIAVVLLVLDWYPLRRWHPGTTRRLVIEKVPFVVLALASAAVAARDAAGSGYNRSLADYGVAQRAAQCFYGLAFYVWKTVLPTGLSPLYPIPPHLDPLAPRFVASAAVVVVFTAVLLVRARRHPGPFAAWICAVVVLAPVLGVIQAGLQIAADRYTYVPAVALSAVVAGRALDWGAGRRLLAAVVLACFAVLSWRQAARWHDSETLWRHAVAVDPANVFAHNDLGSALVEQNRLDDAATEFEAAIALNPAMVDAQFNLGVIRGTQGRYAESVAHFDAVLAIHPTDAQAQTFRDRAGAALRNQEQ
jgi:tetratricopeptide (TPR) repeat protein